MTNETKVCFKHGRLEIKEGEWVQLSEKEEKLYRTLENLGLETRDTKCDRCK